LLAFAPKRLQLGEARNVRDLRPTNFIQVLVQEFCKDRTIPLHPDDEVVSETAIDNFKDDFEKDSILASSLRVTINSAIPAAKGTQPIRSLFSTILLGSICFGFGIAAENHAIAQLPEGISLPTKLRVQQTAGWWPTNGTAAKEQFAGSAACIRCHADKSATFATTEMAHAAVSIEDSAVARTPAVLQLRASPYDYELKNVQGKNILLVSDAKVSVSQSVSWSFGLGRMGQTYLYEQDGNYYEAHVSYYSALHALDITPGQTHAIPSSLESAAGRRMSTEETQLCFGCHTTGSTLKGQFDPGGISLGITCEACHGPGANHVASENLGTAPPGESLIFNPASLDRVASVDFCGACHRTWEDVLTLNPGLGIFNVRFAPYRLENSKCWKQGDGRITCLACHDPHRPLSHDTSSYDSACLQCHSRTPPGKRNAGRAVATCRVAAKDCVTCHMPKYEPPGLHSSFTDHWIRVVRAKASYPE
jgi:Cytochrome c3